MLLVNSVGNITLPEFPSVNLNVQTIQRNITDMF